MELYNGVFFMCVLVLLSFYFILYVRVFERDFKGKMKGGIGCNLRISGVD